MSAAGVVVITVAVIVVIIVSILLFKKKKGNTYPPEVHVYPLLGSTMPQKEVQVNVHIEQKTAPAAMESRNVGFENQATPSRMGADVANEGVA